MVTKTTERQLKEAGLFGAAFLVAGLIVHAATKEVAAVPTGLQLLSHTWLGYPGNTYEFEEGSLHTSRTVWRNPTGLDWTYEVMLRFNNIDMWAPTPHTMFLAAGATTTHERVTTMNVPLGSYNAYLDVRVEGELIATFELEPVNIVSVVPEYSGTIAYVRKWHDPMPFWELSVDYQEIPQGKDIHVASAWMNTSEVNMVGHVDLVVRYPDGSEVSLLAVMNQDLEAPPGSGKEVQFESFNANQGGDYFLTTTLSSGGQVLYVASWHYVAVAVPAIELVSHEWFSSGVPRHVGARVARWSEDGWR